MFNFTKNKKTNLSALTDYDDKRDKKAVVPPSFLELLTTEKEATGSSLTLVLDKWRALIASQPVDHNDSHCIDINEAVSDLVDLTPHEWSQRWALGLLLDVIALGVTLEKMSTNPADYEKVSTVIKRILAEEKRNEAPEKGK
jgi:hypothetical protein